MPQRLNRVILAPPGGHGRRPLRRAAGAAGQVRLVRLANGLRVLVKRHANLPLVNMQAFVLAGSMVDDEKTAGRSALVAEMLEHGAAGHSAEEIAEYFDSIGGQMGFSAGRFTIFGSAIVPARGFSAGGRGVCRLFHPAHFPGGGVREGSHLGPGRDRPARAPIRTPRSTRRFATPCPPPRPTTWSAAARPKPSRPSPWPS